MVGVDDANTTNQTFSTVSGGRNNTASGTTTTVSGGELNIASFDYDTVGGGSQNTAGGYQSTVSGGQSNTASGHESTISGGLGNTASETDPTVGGGFNNTANGFEATVSGGGGNTASGSSATVAGGSGNAATGDYSFATGRRAKATHDGAFVWADSLNADFGSTAVNQFNILAQGGTRIFTNNTLTSGVLLAAGGSSWSAISDVAYKQNFALVDAQNILEKLSEMPVGQYNLASQDPSIQHMGPTAQDFHAAFGLGESDTLINSLDSDGVALAAIQGLYQELLDRDARIAALEGAVGIGSVSTNNDSLGFVWLVTWILMGAIVIAGLFVGLRMRRVG